MKNANISFRTALIIQANRKTHEASTEAEKDRKRAKNKPTFEAYGTDIMQQYEAYKNGQLKSTDEGVENLLRVVNLWQLLGFI